MKYLIVVFGLYLFIGVFVLVFKCGRIIDEQIWEYYDQRYTKRFKLFLIIILAAVVPLWPFVLLAKDNIELRKLHITRHVMDEFGKIAEERGEWIDGWTYAKVSSKFFRVYETMGRLMYKEHLKYELDKYRKEGLRPDYSEAAD